MRLKRRVIKAVRNVLGFSILLLAAFTATGLEAEIVIVTDKVTPGFTSTDDPYFDYWHDLTDEGFMPNIDSPLSATISILFSDDAEPHPYDGGDYPGAYSQSNTEYARIMIDGHTIAQSEWDGGQIYTNSFNPTFAADGQIFVRFDKTINRGFVGYDYGDFTIVESTLTVEIEREDSVIAVSAGLGGNISPEDAVTVPYGTSQVFTVTPEEGYYILDIKVDGASIGPVTSTRMGIFSSSAGIWARAWGKSSLR